MRDVTRVLEGHGDYDRLSSREQALVRTGWAERMTERLAELNFEREFNRTGVPYAELDEQGNPVLREPSRPV